MSAHVLLNLKFNNQRAQMLDSIYHTYLVYLLGILGN